MPHRSRGCTLPHARCSEVSWRSSWRSDVDALAHVAEVLGHQRVHRRAVGARRIDHRQQLAHLVEVHVERAAVADEAQPLQVGIGVAAVVVVASRRPAQQPGLFVVAHGIDGEAGRVGELLDLHRLDSGSA